MLNPRITKVTIEVCGICPDGIDGDIRQFVLGIETQEVSTMPLGEPRTIHRHVWQQVPTPLTNVDVGLMQQIIDIAQRYPFRPASQSLLNAAAQSRDARP